MTFKEPHEIYKRRFGRNLGLGLALVGFVALVFGLTVVKVTRGDPMQGFDHSVRIEMTPPTPKVSP